MTAKASILVRERHTALCNAYKANEPRFFKQQGSRIILIGGEADHHSPLASWGVFAEIWSAWILGIVSLRRV